MAAPEESPGPSVRRGQPPSETTTLVLVMGGSISRADISTLCDSVRALLDLSDADPIVCDVGALVHPDAVAVDALARLQLTARRAGRRVRLRDACGELRDLLVLTGLSEVIPPCGDSVVEAEGQAEERKELCGLEEKRDPGDATA